MSTCLPSSGGSWERRWWCRRPSASRLCRPPPAWPGNQTGSGSPVLGLHKVNLNFLLAKILRDPRNKTNVVFIECCSMCKCNHYWCWTEGVVSGHGEDLYCRGQSINARSWYPSDLFPDRKHINHGNIYMFGQVWSKWHNVGHIQQNRNMRKGEGKASTHTITSQWLTNIILSSLSWWLDPAECPKWRGATHAGLPPCLLSFYWESLGRGISGGAGPDLEGAICPFFHTHTHPFHYS